MIRVLHVQKVAGVAGSERHLLTLAPRLDRARFAASMLMLEEPTRRSDQFAEEMRASGVPVHRVSIRGDLDVQCWHAVRGIVRQGFDIVHTHLIHGDLYGATAAMSVRPRPAVVSSKHGYENYSRTSALYRIGVVLNPAINRIVTISDALQEKVAAAEGLPRAKMMTIHYGSDLPADAEPLMPSEPLKLVSVGRLVPVKGHPHLLRALADLSTTGVRVIKASKAGTIRSLNALSPILTNLGRAGDSFPRSLQVGLTFPFVDDVVGKTPQAARDLHMGDYTNLSINLQVAPGDLLAAAGDDQAGEGDVVCIGTLCVDPNDPTKIVDDLLGGGGGGDGGGGGGGGGGLPDLSGSGSGDGDGDGGLLGGLGRAPASVTTSDRFALDAIGVDSELSGLLAWGVLPR